MAGRGAERWQGQDNNSDKMVCCMDVEERNVAKSGYKIIDDRRASLALWMGLLASLDMLAFT